MTLKSDIEFIKTERLLLRRFTPNDLDFLAALHANEVVTRYIGHGKPRSREESEAWLGDVLHLYREMELGQLAVVRQSDGVLIGRCGLWSLYLETELQEKRLPEAWFSRQQVPTGSSTIFLAELGYTFDYAFWGYGYAAEAVRGVIEYINPDRELTQVVSLIHLDNHRSLRLAAKFDVRLDITVACFGRELGLYRWS
jgi:ribosomal-protein-alanine N-acetyltransferase